MPVNINLLLAMTASELRKAEMEIIDQKILLAQRELEIEKLEDRLTAMRLQILALLSDNSRLSEELHSEHLKVNDLEMALINVESALNKAASAEVQKPKNWMEWVDSLFGIK